MKAILLSLGLLLGMSANAATINSGSYDAKNGVVNLNVTYAGGCHEHTFSLQLKSCMESYPVQCPVQLVDNNPMDPCDALINRDISLELPRYMLTDSYFERAFISIHGDSNSSFSFQLPR